LYIIDIRRALGRKIPGYFPIRREFAGGERGRSSVGPGEVAVAGGAGWAHHRKTDRNGGSAPP
jgi:hypothetical protein